jgi:hypothetical protein
VGKLNDLTFEREKEETEESEKMKARECARRKEERSPFPLLLSGVAVC